MTESSNPENTGETMPPSPERSPGNPEPGSNTQTSHPHPKETNMEVHHHAHHHEKKNWKSYTWEFLMLFFAVFCGFLSEYQLEHVIEKDRGRQYVRSFYEDLLTDSAHFNDLIGIYEKKITVLQVIPLCYDSLLSGHPPISSFTRIALISQEFPDLINTDRTLQQLKNAGGLRLLKEEDADSILVYDNLLRTSKAGETSGFQYLQNEIRKTFWQLRDFKTWKDSGNTQHIMAVYDNNTNLLNTYFNELDAYRVYSIVRLETIKKLKDRNEKLIAYFKAKYHYD